MKKTFYSLMVQGRRFALYILLLMLFHNSFAQKSSGVVKGTISDNSGPLEGASISFSGSRTGTHTDANGNYTISLSPGTYTVVASYIGNTRSEVKSASVIAGKETVINIKMEPEKNSQLQEVTVSYGKQRQKEITGSIL